MLFEKLSGLLAKIPADHWGLDLVALVVAALACAGVLFGVITPADLPSVIDGAFYVLTIAGLRGAALAARKSAAAAATAAALQAVDAAKSHKPADVLAAASAAAAAVKVRE